ncbi:MAG: phosphoglycerate mutase family protein [Bacteroidetes bacterium]|nr:phosphoglycerate mutase family protein [Bacteroidota bacterium]MBU1680352.1 phosphoglycerate mutase family protein [Bacteroidota bacterium]MBU2506495.1 phosphoglycerate mutase family protein [Bacteroidota bacterium]
MTLGFVRHFKVDVKFDKILYSTSQFNEIMQYYDVATVIPNEVNLNGINWEKCFCSSLPRAVTTAKAIYKNEIITTDLLHEVPLPAFTNKEIVLPGLVWHWGGRVAWYYNKISLLETRSQSNARADKIIEQILSAQHQNILIVTHGFFMGVLLKKLYKLGFKGETDLVPKNGKLYILKNSDVG